MTDQEISAVRPAPWPLLTTVAAVWVLVAAVALGVALGDGDGPSLEAIPWDHLVALELLSLATWVALSVPGLALIRLPWLSRFSVLRAFLVGGVLGLGFSLLFALAERKLLQLVTTPTHEALAAQILPDLDARILGFLAMVALVRVTPVLARERLTSCGEPFSVERDVRPFRLAPSPRAADDAPSGSSRWSRTGERRSSSMMRIRVRTPCRPPRRGPRAGVMRLADLCVWAARQVAVPTHLLPVRAARNHM